VRRGKVTARSGQGATCFKWPWDAVAIVPTSLQRLTFRADQITSEKVGVEIVGLAVYRIADPLLAFRVLNFSFPERAQEKLEQTLTAMFVGATRRIVATLTVEDCLRKRKAALAEELLKEIAPVVGGSGHPDDFTAKGWGLVIDTIEIQEVRVLSGAVFDAMQVPYRAELDRDARRARALAEQAIAEREATCQWETELARMRAEDDLADKRAAADLKRAEAEARDRRRKAELTAEQARSEIDERHGLDQLRLQREADLDAQRSELAKRQADVATERVVHAMDLAVREADAQAGSLPAQQAAHEQHAELERLRSALEAELRRRAAEAARDEGVAQADAAMRHADVAARNAEAQARLELARKLPALAEAMGSRMGEVNITQIGGDANPFSQVTGALVALLDLARRVGGSESD